jgi:hypothetical protein
MSTDRELLVKAAEPWKIEVVPVIVRDLPDAHRVSLSVGCQHFHVGPDCLDTREDAEWFAEQLETALIRAKAPVTKAMVGRFLSWKLPETFGPDCFVTFDREAAKKSVAWPIGTNILTADEATAMLEHVLNQANADEAAKGEG